MSFQLRFFATFREAVGTKTITREYDAETVGDVLLALEDEFEGLTGELLDEGSVRPQVNVLLNGRDVEHEAGPETPIEPGDTLSIFPPVAGGCSGGAEP
ncbi:ubiquitin-like small modifier protein 1 [Halobellus sp. GM3]|uniref:ubiquitin-like small modifier protein 1 n=1 Tax=Halobellus sp. GM3 TaxID=3458410 RepID=UPI00403E03F4